MAVDTPRVQRKIAKWTALATILIGGITYFLGIKQFTYGLVFGVVLCIINYRVISLILEVAFRSASPDLARVISFASYHIRFWVIVIILYIIIPRTHYLFVIGTFLGILLPKMIMGVVVVLHTGDREEIKKPEPVETELHEVHRIEEGLRFPGLDFDERFCNDPRFKDPDQKI